MLNPIYSLYRPMRSNIIEDREQITMDLVSKDVTVVFFDSMVLHRDESKVSSLTFAFTVFSKIRVYENLKNVYQESIKKQNFSSSSCVQNTVGSRAKIKVDLSSKNVKYVLFESLIPFRNKRRVSSLAFRFTVLSNVSNKPIYENAKTLPDIAFSNPLYEIEESKTGSSKSSDFEEAPPVDLKTLPKAIFYTELSAQKAPKNKGSLEKSNCFLKRFLKRFLKKIPHDKDPVELVRYTPLYSYSAFGYTEVKAPIYEEIAEKNPCIVRTVSEDSGYETPRNSLGICSSSVYEEPLNINPPLYLEVLPDLEEPIYAEIGEPVGYEVLRQVDPIYLEVLP